MKKLLVAVTYHNQKRATVRKTIQSVFAANATDIYGPTRQSWSPELAIFCNQTFFKDHAECAIITNEETLGGKRNFAIDYARANNFELICFLDDDDLFGVSWISKLCQAYDEADEHGKCAIYHPQWNVLFGPDWYKLHEHIASDDPRFDSRDCLVNNPWSALCAFNPFKQRTVRYKCHLATDKTESFEDWSFNLDTYCNDIKHAVVKDTFHFLRIRENSLGKSTARCSLAHKLFFLDDGLRNSKHATEDYLQDKYTIDTELLKKEFEAIHQTEPALYFYKQEKIEQEHYGRAQTLSTAVDLLGDFRGIRDVFWTVDHIRSGGAEKALGFASRFLSRFPLAGGCRQLWIDDVIAAKPGLIKPTEWVAALRNVLRAWATYDNTVARSLHICNSFMAWQMFAFNPLLFKNIQVYLYVFNDDVIVKSTDELSTKGYHSPLYRFADQIDLPNIHIITDSDHFARRIHKMTGLGDKVRKIKIPVIQQENKHKPSPDGITDILWAGRLDYFKGVEKLCEIADNLDPKKFRITVWGDGDDKFKNMLKATTGPLVYKGGYKSFEYIDGKYDFCLFTSEREGMPNVVKEAIASGLNVIAANDNWCMELDVRHVFSEKKTGAEIAALLSEEADSFSLAPPPIKEDPELPNAYAMNAFKECLA